MNLDDLKRNRWDGGKLFTFSGLDGETDYVSSGIPRLWMDSHAVR